MLNKRILYYSATLIIGAYFLFLGLSEARDILAPLLTAVILALVILPLANKMESKMKRSYSSLLNTLLLFLVSVALIALLSFQVKAVVEKWPEIKETMKPKIEQAQNFISENTPLQLRSLQNSEDGSFSLSQGSNTGEMITTAFSSTMAFMGTYLLTFIYIFFLLNYRNRFKSFLFDLFPDEKKDEVEKITNESASVVQQYLVGKLLLIGFIAILYCIGLGVSGISNFILLSIIAAILTLIPYIGNIIGFAVVIVFGYLTSGETGVLIGIIVTFTAAQFVESYILQPYVVGDKVDLHPFFVILAVIIGNAVWGVIGMILSIPVLAIVVIVFLHIPPLKPFGFLFSNKEY
ncbi:MAG: AI-2E family transporter [Balneolaceae bacterium]